ncbi:thiolase domain-containing protein [Geoglobus acetivorans]|nr:thiolase domain-containing protein [Geoglobus acetivorans]
MIGMREVAIVGAGITRFGVREASWRDLVQEAGKAVFDDVPNLDRKDIDSLFVGAAQPERWVFQTHVAPYVAELLGINVSRVISRTEVACASGQAAIRYAWLAVATGLSDIAMVVGVEKMNSKFMSVSQSSMINVGNREFDGVNGFTAPPFFAMVAQRHMHEFGTTSEQLAMIRVKNSYYGARNPYAQFQKEVTVEKVLGSRMVAPPLTLFDCSAITDGACALILASEERAREFTDTPVWILGGVQHVDSAHTTNQFGDLSHWVGLRKAANDLYSMLKISPEDIDMAEVHDCFTISEILEYEELGFCRKGEGGKFIEEGESYIGGKVAVNPGGGLLSNGHPLGATGVRQAWEMVMQFRGDVPKERYVDGAELGIAHNLSGMAQLHHIMAYSINKRKDLK